MRVVLAAPLIALLLLASPARAALDGDATLVADETGYTLTITNFGDEPIKCMRFTLDVAGITSVEGPGRPIAVGRQFTAEGFAIAARKSAEWRFTTDRALRGGRVATLDVSSRCVQGTDKSLVVALDDADLEVTDIRGEIGPLPGAVGLGFELREIRGANKGPSPALARFDLEIGAGFRTTRVDALVVGSLRAFEDEEKTTTRAVQCSVSGETDGAQAVCPLGLIPDGGGFFVTVRGEHTRVGDHEMTARVSSPQPDPEPRNNVKTASVAVYPTPDADISPFRVQPTGRTGRVSGTASRTRDPAQKLRASAAAFAPRLQRLARVEVAVLRDPAAKKGPCRWLKSPRGGFKAIPRGKAGCDRAVWLRAAGTTSWSFTLPANLPDSNYVVLARAVNAAGVAESRFTAKDRNRLPFSKRTAAAAQGGGATAQVQLLYETVEIPPGGRLDKSILCGRGYVAVGGSIHRVDLSGSTDVRTEYSAAFRGALWRFVIFNEDRAVAARVTLVVQCRRLPPSLVRPRRPVVGTPWVITVPKRMPPRAFFPRCPVKSVTPTFPAPASGVPADAPPAPTERLKEFADKALKRLTAAALGEKHVELEPRGPRVAGASDTAARIVAAEPTATGFKITAAGGSVDSKILVQVLCLDTEVAERDRAPRRMATSRFSLARTVAPGTSTVGTRCPAGQSPVSTSASLPASGSVRQVASPLAPDGTTGWSFANDGTAARVRLHLVCAAGAIADVKGEAVVETVAGPPVVTQVP